MLKIFTQLLFSILLLFIMTWTMAATSSHDDECVILIHGLGRSSGSMETIADSLRRQQYNVWNVDYDSRSERIESLAAKVITPGINWCKEQGVEKIHFVTHSLGGILVRYYFQHRIVPEVSRIVMLAPPSQGSTVTDWLKENYLYKKITGPAGQQLGTDASSLPNQLVPIAAEIGVIAGSSSVDPWFSPFIEGDNDGKVRVDDTRLEEMQDFLVVDHSHTFIMRADDVIQQIQYFLDNGKFDRSTTSEAGELITNDVK